MRRKIGGKKLILESLASSTQIFENKTDQGSVRHGIESVVLPVASPGPCPFGVMYKERCTKSNYCDHFR